MTLKVVGKPTKQPAIIGPVVAQPLIMMAVLFVSSPRAGGMKEPTGESYYSETSLKALTMLLKTMSDACTAVQETGEMPAIWIERITRGLKVCGAPPVGGKADAEYEAVDAIGVRYTEESRPTRFDVEAIRLLAIAVKMGGRMWNAARYRKPIGPVQVNRFVDAEAAFLAHIRKED